MLYQLSYFRKTQCKCTVDWIFKYYSSSGLFVVYMLVYKFV